MSTFYVYAYLRSRDSENGKSGSPYYIGKGQGSRRFRMHGKRKAPTDSTLNVILSDNLTEEEAHQEEVRLIKLHGRIDLGTGCLRNLTNGGEGQAGRSPDVSEKVRQALLGKKHEPERIEKNKQSHVGKQMSPQQVEKESSDQPGKNSFL